MAGPWEQYAQASEAAPTSSVTVSAGPWSQFSDAEVVSQTPQQKMTNFDYIANQAKLGLTDTAVLGQAIIDTFVTEPIKSLVGTPVQGGMGERFSKNVKRLQEAAGTVTGAMPETTAPSALSEVVGSGARMLSDPLGYLGTGAMKAGVATAEKIAPVVARAGGLFGMGATSGVGGIAGEQLGQAYPEVVSPAEGKALGQLAGIGIGIPTSAAMETGIKSMTNMASQLYDKYKMVKADPDAASQAYASGAAKRFLDLVAKGLPEGSINNVMTEFNRIGSKVETGNIPLFVAMSDNPLVQTEVTRLVKTNPSMRQAFENEVKTLMDNIDNASTDLFGSRYTPVKGTTTPLTTEINKNIKLREAVDAKLDDLAIKFPEPDNAALGIATENLLEVRSKAAKAEMTPIYDGIKEGAAKAGATLPDTGVRDIYSFVQANQMQDIFGRGTPMDKLIQKNFAPVNGEFYPASFKDVVSLKEEINRVQRSVRMDDRMKMRLNDLEDVVDGARSQIKGSFNQQLMDADKQYYEKVGIPFSSQGIKDIDSKKYADQVAPQIVKSGETLRQFLKAGGNEGAVIANNAIMSEAYKKVLKNDAVDPKALTKFIKDKSAVLDQLPGTRQELEKVLFDDSALKLRRVDLDNKVKQAEKDIADNFILSVKDSDGIAIPNYSELSSRLFTDPRFFGKITKDLANVDKRTSKAVLRNIQAEVVEKARNSTDGGIGFLTNPKNATVMNKVFGPGYQKEVKDLMVISDALGKADISKISSVINQSDLDVLGKIVPGLDVPYVTSTLRDRISSNVQKVVRLVSRAKTAQLKTDTDLALKELLLDRDGLRKLQAIKNTMDFKLRSPISVKQVSDTIGSVVPRYLYGALKEETLTSPPAQQQNTTPQFGDFEGPYSSIRQF